MEKCLKEPEPISDYWLTAFKNSIVKELMREEEEPILTYLRNVSTGVTKDSIEVTFTFQDNEFVKGGSYSRKIILDNGSPISYKGDQIISKK